MDEGRTSTNEPENKKTNDGAKGLRDDIDRLYVLRKEEGRGLTSTVNSMEDSSQALKDSMIKSKERLITATRNNTDNIMFNWITIRKQKYKEKQFYRYFKPQTVKISH